MTAQDLTALADKLDELAELAMKAAASPLSFSPQNGAAGHCMVAQVWNEAGDSVAQFDPSENDQCATALAELFTLAVNNRPTLTTALREAARLREVEAFVEFFDAHEAKLEWEGSHYTNDWAEWRRRYERYEAALKTARIARAALKEESRG